MIQIIYTYLQFKSIFKKIIQSISHHLQKIQIQLIIIYTPYCQIKLLYTRLNLKSIYLSVQNYGFKQLKWHTTLKKTTLPD